MNERIEKLAQQAWVNIVTTKGMEDVEDGCIIVHPDRLQEFAELIVKECARKVNEDTTPDSGYTYEPWKLLEHFGVEE